MDLSDFTPTAHAEEIADTILDPRTKGVPPTIDSIRLGEIGARGWNLLRGDLPLPAAVMHVDRLRRNSRWMAEFLKLNGLEIAPHGKTTMTPQLFALQLRDGAWAITVGTAQQLAVARHFGVKRALLANQPIGRLAVDACFAHLKAAPDNELYLLADSLPGVAMLAEGAKRAGTNRSLSVLLEVGFPGGRTGCRDVESAMAVGEAVARTPGLSLAGIEAFEGLLKSAAEVDAFLDRFAEVAQQAAARGLFRKDGPIVITAGGSAFYDRVARRFGEIKLPGPMLRVIRSGCYIAHDQMGYEQQYRRIKAAGTLRLPGHDLVPALEVWTYVQSRPDRTKAIVTMGQRDIGRDAGWPIPTLWHRPGTSAAPQPLPAGHAIETLNDQHGHLIVPADSPLAIGDMVCFGIGHPCTTFDKWQVMMLVSEGYDVVGAVRTYF